ncbi:agamous-like MADS-box protein FUL-L [Cornus florida]|uniref:agamous-like MADS-box protein FUL-L n=1 Tax=Cornus florida TaxID=4283 RepID=UPI00289D6C61|nr:agamous-like MADS-box protein FUL-L [Cornus florida]
MAPKPKKELIKKKLIRNEKDRYISFRKRRNCLEKKAFELSTLCGVDVCIVIYGPKPKDHRLIDDQQPYMWPKDLDAIRHIFTSYEEQSLEDRNKWTLDLSHFMEEDNPNKQKEAAADDHETDYQGTSASSVLAKAEDKKNNDDHDEETTKNIKYPTWDHRFNNLSKEQLRNLGTKLEENLDAFKTRLQELKSNHQNENYSGYFMPSSDHIIDNPISFFSDLDVPVPLDLSMPANSMAASSSGSNVTNTTPTFYDPNLLTMMNEDPNLMMMMNDEDWIGFDATYNTATDPVFDDRMFDMVENVIMDDPMPPMCYYVGPDMEY